MSERFSWTDDAECVIVRRQDPIAIYLNDEGAIILRQQDELGDEDQAIVIQSANVQAVADALLAAANESREARLIQRAAE